MKKVLSMVLCVTVLLTLAFSTMTVSAANGSLLPSKAEDFTVVPGGPNKTEKLTAKAAGTGFEFVSDAGGWPTANYQIPNEADWVKADTNDAGAYLNWDFEVVSGGANIIVYFAGQSMEDQPSAGSAETINYYIDKGNNNLASGQVKDLPVGKYKGSIHVKDTGISELLMEEGVYYISGIKIYAVGGKVIVNDVSVGAKKADTAATTTTTKKADPATTTAAQTTATGSTPSSAQTGDVSNAVIFIVVAAVAAGVVVMSVVSKKKKN